MPALGIYRLARKPSCWTAPILTYTGTGRFDDPLHKFRVLYASSFRLGCFLESLARFRADFSLLDELKQIKGKDDFQPLGIVPNDWLINRLLGSANLGGTYADVLSAEWIGWLRVRLSEYCAKAGVQELDTSAILSPNRQLTQEIARTIYIDGLSGIRYHSKFGYDIVNWAIFEPFRTSSTTENEISITDPDLLAACVIHGLQLLNKPK